LCVEDKEAGYFLWLGSARLVLRVEGEEPFEWPEDLGIVSEDKITLVSPY
jgi:hypothetical protein